MADVAGAGVGAAIMAIVGKVIELRKESDTEKAAASITANLEEFRTTAKANAELLKNLDERMTALERRMEQRHDDAIRLWKDEVARLNRIIYDEATEARDREGDLRVANAELATTALAQLERNAQLIEKAIPLFERVVAALEV